MEYEKAPQRQLPDEVVEKGFTKIPNGLINKSLGLTQTERLFIQYLLMKQDGYVFYTSLIEQNTGIDRTTINKIKNKLKFLKYTNTGTGAYNSGWTVDFTGLWALIAQSTKEKNNPSAADVRTRRQKATPNSTQNPANSTPKRHNLTPNPANSTPNPPLLTPITPINSFLTPVEQEEEFESNTTDSLEQRDKHLIQPKHETKEEETMTKKIVTPAAPKTLEEVLMASLEEDEWESDQRIKKELDAVPIRDKITEFFSAYFPNNNDYSPAFRAAKISNELLQRFWAVKDHWANWTPIAKTDRSLYMLIKNIEKFVPAIEASIKRDARTRAVQDKQVQDQNDRISRLREYVWIPSDDDHLDGSRRKAVEAIDAMGEDCPSWLYAWRGNPMGITDQSGKYLKENILSFISTMKKQKPKVVEEEINFDIDLLKDDEQTIGKNCARILEEVAV